MVDHRTRLIVIAALAAIVLVAVVLLHVLAPESADGLRDRLEGMLLLLLPATLDAGAEQAKRLREGRAEPVQR